VTWKMSLKIRKKKSDANPCIFGEYGYIHGRIFPRMTGMNYHVR
jgi:hypothetical protein